MSYHFIGLGGIGMSALARILLQRGEKVGGTDQKNSSLLDELRKEGADVLVGHQANAVPPNSIIIRSTDIPEQHIELNRARELNLPILHRSDLLNRLVGKQSPLLVTGSHGKTTTTALLASTLLEAGLDPSFVVGGILLKERTNGRSGTGPYFVAEADESDGSFLKTSAFGAIVTNLDREHMNYWKTEERLQEAFRCFFHQVQNHTHLFWCIDDPGLHALHPPGVSYGFSSSAQVRIFDFHQNDQGISFSLSLQGTVYPSIELPLFGIHNALNGAAVFALALSLGVEEQKIRNAFLSFQGTHRRLEKLGTIQKVDFYDDYGHHPTEITATLRALRKKIGERRLIVLFQPHRYSRLSDLFYRYVHAFEGVDELIVTDVYAAGESPIEGLDGATLAQQLEASYLSRPELEQKVRSLLQFGDVVLTLGAGDITSVGKRLIQLMEDNPIRWTVGVLFGGASAEHAISLCSAQNILSHLNPKIHQIKQFGIRKDGSWVCGSDAMQQISESNPLPRRLSPEVLTELTSCDVCIPVLHGPHGEDGMIAAFLETLGIPYVGCDYDSAALCMQKIWTKQVAQAHGLPVLPFVEGSANHWKKNRSELIKKVTQTLSYPVWVKPVHLGSSIGISRATQEEELIQAIILAFRYDDRVIIEQEVIGREIEFALRGNDHPLVGAPGEILCEKTFYDYEKKYGPQASKVQTPAALTSQQEQQGKALALKAYEACGCKGLARIDFFLDQSGAFWLNEINPLPGFTLNSLYPKMWEATGISQSELIDELLILALHRNRTQKKRL